MTKMTETTKNDITRITKCMITLRHKTVNLNSIMYLCIPPHVSHQFYVFGAVSSSDWLPEKTMCKKLLPG